MATITDLAIGTDNVPSKGTTSPVTWKVFDTGANKVTWRNTTSTIYSLFPSISLGWRQPTAKSKLTRATVKFIYPIDRPTVDSASNTTHNVVGSIQFNVEAIFPTITTQTERNEAQREFMQAMLDAQFLNVLCGYSFPFTA
jgi:hypothetical protein